MTICVLTDKAGTRAQIPPHPRANLTLLCGAPTLLEGDLVTGVGVVEAAKNRVLGLTPKSTEAA